MSGKTYAQLVAELDELDRQIAVARVQARKEALEQISALMFEFDIRPNDLRRPRNMRYNVQPTRPRYRDPKTGATWSGRGHMPAWIEGKDKRLFLIDGE